MSIGTLGSAGGGKGLRCGARSKQRGRGTFPVTNPISYNFGEDGRGGEKYILNIALADQPIPRNIKILSQVPTHSFHKRDALRLAIAPLLEVLYEGEGVEVVHVGRGLEMRRFVLFVLFWRFHMENAFEGLLVWWFGAEGSDIFCGVRFRSVDSDGGSCTGWACG